MEISIVIPVYDDNISLNKCLVALENQTGEVNFEIIIVNNLPSKKIKLDKEYHLNIKIVDEPKIGSYAARNKGIKYCKANIIAFTDADCVPDKNWVKNSSILLSDNKTYRVCGPVNLLIKGQIKSHELMEILFDFNYEKFFKKGWAMTANLLVKKEIFSHIGFFNNSLVSGGDMEWNLRAKEYPLVYSEKISVSHPSRTMQKHILKEKRIYSFFYFQREEKFNRFFVFLLGIWILKPPFKKWIELLRYRKKYGLWLTLRAMSYAYYLKWFVFNEHYRLFFGGKPVNL